jgi:hypothetical protein
LGRRRGKVRVKVRVIGVGVVRVIFIIFSVGVSVILVLVLLLRVLLLGAPRRTIIRRPQVIGGDILLRGLVGWQASSLDDYLLRNLMGLSNIFFAD